MDTVSIGKEEKELVFGVRELSLVKGPFLPPFIRLTSITETTGLLM